MWCLSWSASRGIVLTFLRCVQLLTAKLATITVGFIYFLYIFCHVKNHISLVIVVDVLCGRLPGRESESQCSMSTEQMH